MPSISSVAHLFVRARAQRAQKDALHPVQRATAAEPGPTAARLKSRALSGGVKGMNAKCIGIDNKTFLGKPPGEGRSLLTKHHAIVVIAKNLIVDTHIGLGKPPSPPNKGHADSDKETANQKYNKNNKKEGSLFLGSCQGRDVGDRARCGGETDGHCVI